MYIVVYSACMCLVLEIDTVCGEQLLLQPSHVCSSCASLQTISSHKPIIQAQETLDSSHQEMNESFSSVFAFLQEQQQIITKMFEEFNLVTDSLSFLLSIFQGKVTFLHSLLFFVLASTLSYAATGYKYTHQARPWLYVVCTSNFLLEAAAVLYQQVWASAGGVSAKCGLLWAVDTVLVHVHECHWL